VNRYNFTYQVRLDDLDYMNIVGNSQWMIFLERARIDLLEKIGFPFSEMMKMGVGGVVAEAHVKFIKPAFFNDKLTISIMPHSQFSKGFKLKYLITNQESAECLDAELTMVFVDKNGKSTLIPEPVKNVFFAS
jgi:acyl-CoA thioester hydrolase